MQLIQRCFYNGFKININEDMVGGVNENEFCVFKTSNSDTTNA